MVARWCGVKVETFAIGFGKEIFGWTDKHGTRWKVCLIPLGGYVKMFGDEGAASNPDNEKLQAMSDEEKKLAFNYKSLPAKFAIVSAGPLANFILTILILSFFFAYYGRPETTAEIGVVSENSAAQEVGLQEGDIIIEANGDAVDRFADLQSIVALHPDIPINIKYLRNDIEKSISITPKSTQVKDAFDNDVKIGRIGVTSGNIIYEKLPVLAAIKGGFVETYNLCSRTMTALKQMIVGQRDASQLSGILRITEYSGKSAEKGFKSVLWFMALLSANLGLINLFPIPMLDGGHLFFYIIEAVRGKPMSVRAQEYLFKFGFFVLIGLMSFAIFNDFVHFAKKFGLV